MIRIFLCYVCRRNLRKRKAKVIELVTIDILRYLFSMPEVSCAVRLTNNMLVQLGILESDHLSAFGLAQW